MIILAINAGSATVKYALFRNGNLVCKGIADRIGFSDSSVSISSRHLGEKRIAKRIPNHKTAIESILGLIIEFGIVKNLMQIDAICHRVVHGGELFKESVIIDKKVISAIRKYAKLAPLHNPPNLYGIEACIKLLPRKRQVAIFDTSFHQTIPETNYLYPIPFGFYKKYKIRRYGFHGISHRFVATEAARMLKRDIKKLKIISCHVGSGVSITAVKNGKSIDTSMGFTPLEGLMMCTRSGDIDAGALIYLLKEERISAGQLDKILNNKSGIRGIYGFSSDFRDVLKNLENKKTNAGLAFEMFVHRIVKYIGAYAAVMNGVDVIVFTAGIGENSYLFREAVLKKLEFLGVRIDKYANRNVGDKKAAVISAKDSEIVVLVVKTDEEREMAKETELLLKKTLKSENKKEVVKKYNKNPLLE